MILNNIPQNSTYTTCDKCKTRYKAEPYGLYAPMCVKCHTFQNLCDNCVKNGCIICGAEIPILIH